MNKTKKHYLKFHPFYNIKQKISCLQKILIILIKLDEKITYADRIRDTFLFAAAGDQKKGGGCYLDGWEVCWKISNKIKMPTRATRTTTTTTTTRT